LIGLLEGLHNNPVINLHVVFPIAQLGDVTSLIYRHGLTVAFVASHS
jgi:hypothetical protein